MNTIVEKITELIKEMLQGWVMSNLEGMFTDVNTKVALTGEDDYDALSYGLKYSDDERERIQDNAGSDSITFNASAHGLYIYEPGEYTLTLTQGIRITDPDTGSETVQMLTEDDNGFKCETNPLTKTINVTRNEDGSIQIEEV